MVLRLTGRLAQWQSTLLEIWKSQIQPPVRSFFSLTTECTDFRSGGSVVAEGARSFFSLAYWSTRWSKSVSMHRQRKGLVRSLSCLKPVPAHRDVGVDVGEPRWVRITQVWPRYRFALFRYSETMAWTVRSALQTDHISRSSWKNVLERPTRIYGQVERVCHPPSIPLRILRVHPTFPDCLPPAERQPLTNTRKGFK